MSENKRRRSGVRGAAARAASPAATPLVRGDAPLRARLGRALAAVLRDMDRARHQHGALSRGVPQTRRASAANLLDYLALRRHDLRETQLALAGMGLSSLGRSESAPRAGVRAVLGALGRTEADRSGGEFDAGGSSDPWTVASLDEGRAVLADRAVELFGGRVDHPPRIMVTMPTEAARDPRLIRSLLRAGMDVMRINCAHDAPAAWAAMIGHLRQAQRESGRSCRVMMDIAGPKARTGPLRAGAQVVSWNPPRDELGSLVRPATVFLSPRGATDERTETGVVLPPDVDAVLPLADSFLRTLRAGDRLEFRDARGLSRELTVTGRATRQWAPEIGPVRGVLARSDHAAYVTPGVVISTPRSGTIVGPLAPVARALLLFEGDALWLTRDQRPGCEARAGSTHADHAACIPFTLPTVLSDVRPGHRVMLDDGKIEGVAERVTSRGVLVRITRSRPEGTKLLADRGVNLPDTPMRVPALSPKDLSDLDFVARHSDLVGFSFAREVDDLRSLQRELGRRGGRAVGVILKIETRRAFENLPALLLEGLRFPAFGVMIARGDLAVEVGWERLAEVQEEILCLCEAAHTPVVWATQVLENLAKRGLPSRSEITDAAAGQRAECVMLNKGPFITQAVRALRDILRRMGGHQSKRRQLLRSLRVAERFARS